MGIVVLAALGTVVAYSLGVPLEMTGVLFVALLAALAAAGWSRIEEAHPRHGNREDE